MSAPAIRNPLAIAESLTERWAAQLIAEVDDRYVKVAKVQGDLAWHSHEKEDELFFKLRGELLALEPEGSRACLRAGGLQVVPRGKRHRPIAEQECLFMRFERKVTPHTGGEVTARIPSLADQLRRLTANQGTPS